MRLLRPVITATMSTHRHEPEIMRPHLLLSALMATPAIAATPAEAEKAQAIYAEGVAAFKGGDYQTALDRFEAAHALDPSPILLYNMARANEELGRPAASVARYEAYLEASPDARDRADVERRIRIMKAILENVEGNDRQALTATEVPPQPISLRPFAYGALGVGAAMLVVGIIGAVELESARDDFVAADTVKEKQRAEDDGSNAAITANVGWITGGLLIAAGGVLWALEPDAVPISAGTVPDGPKPSGLMLQWSTRW